VIIVIIVVMTIDEFAERPSYRA